MIVTIDTKYSLFFSNSEHSYVGMIKFTLKTKTISVHTKKEMFSIYRSYRK